MIIIDNELVSSTNLEPSASYLMNTTLNTPKTNSNLEIISVNFGPAAKILRGAHSVFGKAKSEPDYGPFMHGHLPLPVNSKADYGMDGFGSDGMRRVLARFPA